MSGVGFAPVRIGPLILVHPELLKNMSTLPPALLDDWYLPYWELTRSICKLEGSHKHKSIELGKLKPKFAVARHTHTLSLSLFRGSHANTVFFFASTLAALLAMEQLAVGSLIHFEVLCEAAEQAEKDMDVGMSLQNPYVTMFVERFLNRDQYLDLKESHLSAGARLIGLVSTYMDKAALDFLSAERLARIEAILEQQNKGATATLAEVDLQHIVTVRWIPFYKSNDAGHVTGMFFFRI